MQSYTPSQQQILNADRKLWPQELCFTEQDFAERLARTQQKIAQQSLEGVLLFDPENMFWLTGYQTIGYFTFQAMFVPATGKPILITRVVNQDLGLALSTIDQVVPIFDTQNHISVLAGFLQQRVTANSPVGLETVSRYLSIFDHRQLVDKSNNKFADWNGVIESFRMIKSPEQLKRMRAAGKAVAAGVDAALKEIAPGKTDNDLAAALIAGSTRAGSEYFGHPPMVATGPRTELCFALWNRRTIEQGDVVLLEGAGVVDRYHAMMSRSAVLGQPTDEHKATEEALIEILETAQANIKPGLTAGEIDHLCRSKVEAKGLGKYFKSRTAYGIGIGFPPNWAEGHIYAIRPEDPLMIEENMTFHIIPTIFRDGFGMAISDSVCVTKSGCELLTHYPRDLVIVD